MCYDFRMTKKQQSGSSAGDDDLTAKVQAAAATDHRIAMLEKKIEELTEQLQRHTDVASRAQAELQNAKARFERDGADIRTFAAENVLLKLLPTVDNLQRAIKQLPGDLVSHEWVKGIIATEQQLLRQLAELGLRRFESHGQSVNAERHEVLMQGSGLADHVTDVIEEGYELHGKVVRPAKVKVGDGSGAA